MADNMPALRMELSQISRRARLTSAVDDVDKIIARLTEARSQIASDPHSASLVLTKLQNPVKEGFDKVNEDLKAVSKTQKELGKALDRSFPVTALPTDHDVMADHPALINRAIAMHLLREGHFSVASVFMDEVREMAKAKAALNSSNRYGDDSSDDDMAMATGQGGNEDEEEDDDDETMSRMVASAAATVSNFTQNESLDLQEKFQCMYSILQAIKSHELQPAISWAQANSEALEARGSNLEFELCKLQFIWLAKAPNGTSTASSHLADAVSTGDLGTAFQYARNHFDRFQERHLSEIQRLAAALVFAPNIQESPYANVFDTSSAFDEVAATFTREFCSLLGLSAESPLYVAATAGIIALPRLIKFIGATRSKRTEWTTANELAFETPLPESMIYHSIFVCPVSKEQTTESNPPMRLPCGHVLARESLLNLAKGSKFKCPYCPSEGQLKDAHQIIL